MAERLQKRVSETIRKIRKEHLLIWPKGYKRSEGNLTRKFQKKNEWLRLQFYFLGINQKVLGFESETLSVDQGVDCVEVVWQLLLGMVSEPAGIHINYHGQQQRYILSKH